MGIHRWTILAATLSVLTGCASHSATISQRGVILPSQMAQPLAATRELPPPEADYDRDELAQQRRAARAEREPPMVSLSDGFSGGSCH